jgi:hypothetical protein
MDRDTLQEQPDGKILQASFILKGRKIIQPAKLRERSEVLTSGRPNVGRVLLGGIMAGSFINAAEYLVHRLLLDPQWKAAFAVLGKTPTGWASFIPSGFLIGIIGIWIYAKFRPNYGPGPLTALRSAVLIWAVFWAIPMMAIQPMHLFPNSLIFITIAVGLMDSVPAVLLGAWIYRS